MIDEMTRYEVTRFSRALQNAADQGDGGDIRDVKKAIDLLRRLNAARPRWSPWSWHARRRIAELEKLVAEAEAAS
jgi:hypothetical protein